MTYLIVDETASTVDDSDHLVLVDLGGQGVLLRLQVVVVHLVVVGFGHLVHHGRVVLDVLVLHIYARQEELVVIHGSHRVLLVDSLGGILLLSFVFGLFLNFKCADSCVLACHLIRLGLLSTTVDSTFDADLDGAVPISHVGR